jgi:nicotinic acid phosphoribosyltransferase
MLEEIDIVVSDGQLDRKTIQALEQAGVTVL